MSLLHLDTFILALLTGLVMAILLAVLGIWAWAIPKLLRGEPLLSSVPILPLRPARWGGGTVAAAILLYLAANLVAGIGYGAMSRARGPAPPVDQPQATAKESSSADESPVPSADDADEQNPDAKPRHSSFTMMMLNAVGSLLVVILLPTVLRRSAGVSSSELGVSWKSWPRQVGVGVAAALLTTPAVYAIQTLAARYWEVNDHDVQKMMAENLSPGVAAFALVSTVLLAPLVEEFLFRGVFLGWLTRIFSEPSPVTRSSPVVDGKSMSAELEPGTGCGLGPSSNPTGSESGTGESAGSAGPEADLSRPNVVSPQAIIGTSLLFAGLHAPQWPAPVGIFFLSVVIGVVYQRTGSLVTAIVMHAVFNACGTLLLLQSLLAQAVSNGKPEVPEITPRLQPAVAALVEFWASCF